VRPYRITFALGGLDPELCPKQIATVLECLTWAHALYLANHPEVPSLSSLASSGRLRHAGAPIGFRPDGEEDWLDIPSALRAGKADGRTLSAWVAAELRVRQGVHAKPVIRARMNGRRVEYRPSVKLPDGTLHEVLSNPEAGWRAVGTPQHPDRHRLCYVLDLFQPDRLPLTQATLQCMLDALTDIDARYLQRHPEVAPIHQAGVRYEEEPPGQEDWQDVATTLRTRTCDCDDISPWRAAELRVRLLNARAIMKPQKKADGSSLYHILTLMPDGTVEDTSRDLGMR